MTDEKALMDQFQSLPDALKADVARYITKLYKRVSPGGSAASLGRTAREPGSAAGAYHLAPDFDEPLEDFKEYS